MMELNNYPNLQGFITVINLQKAHFNRIKLINGHCFCRLQSKTKSLISIQNANAFDFGRLNIPYSHFGMR